MGRHMSSIVALAGFVLLAFGSADPPKDRQSSGASSSNECASTCDPKGNGNKYMDAAYEKAYSPCLDEAVRLGKTAAEMKCSEKATDYCVKACENDQ